MNRSPQKRPDPTKELIVKGSGYSPANSTVPNFKPPSSLAPKRSSAAFGLTTRKVRISSQPPVTSTSALKRSGSVGSVLSNRVVLAPRSTTSSSSGERANRNLAPPPTTSQQIICNCQHPADVSFLEDVYVQHLQTQIEVLELENSFLKKQSQISQMPSSSSFHGSVSAYTKPLVREDTVNVPNVPSQPWQVPNPSNFQNRGKRVEFQGKNQEDDDELFLRLEESLQKEQRLEERLKKQIAENRKLSAINEQAQEKLEHVTEELKQLEEKVTKERRNLMEDNIELQRRLDDLTPLLAEKEAQIVKLLNEKENLNSRLRHVTTQMANMQNKLEEQKREGSMIFEMDSERKHEIEQLQNKIKNLENEIEKCKTKEADFIDNLATLQRKLKEEELTSKKEVALYRKVVEDNEQLIKESSSLTSQINRLENIIEQQRMELTERRYSNRRESEFAELKKVEKSLRNELIRMEDKLRREQESVRTLEEIIKDREMGESESRQMVSKTQRELEGLQALSKSLTNENTGLREEKISLSERVEFLQRKLSEKDVEIQELTADLDDFKRKYNEATNQLRRDMDVQSERSQELEEIVRKVHELSDALPRKMQTKMRSISMAHRRQLLEQGTSSSVVSIESVSPSSESRRGGDRISDRYRRLPTTKPD